MSVSPYVGVVCGLRAGRLPRRAEKYIKIRSGEGAGRFEQVYGLSKERSWRKGSRVGDVPPISLGEVRVKDTIATGRLQDWVWRYWFVQRLVGN